MSNEIINENMQNAAQDKDKSPTPLIGPQEITDKIGDLDLVSPEQTENRCDNKEKDVTNTGVAIKTAESEALKLLLNYDSDSSYSSETEIMSFRLDNRVSSSSSSSSSSSDDEDDDDAAVIDDDDDDSVVESNATNQSRGAIKKDLPPKSNGELGMDDLPPVPDLSTLSLNGPEDDFVHMGNVMGIVDRLVTVAALPNTPAYDLETLLFVHDDRKPLGFVFDVLGQVTSPIYAVRFNSVEDIKNLKIVPGVKVYAVPHSKHTQYVFLQQLLKMKGSDASWLGDNEVPVEFADFSDDDNESMKFRVAPHQKRPHQGGDHKKFESTMNKRNLLNTKLNKYMDTFRESRYKPKGRKSGGGNSGGGAPVSGAPVFDPLVPPPGFQHYPAGVGNEVPYLPSEFLGMYVPQQGAPPARGDNNNSRSNPPSGFGGFYGQPVAPGGFLGNFNGYYNATNHQQFGEPQHSPGPSSHRQS